MVFKISLYRVTNDRTIGLHLCEQTQAQTSNEIRYSFHIAVFPLNGEEENEAQKKKKKKEETNNKQTN